MGIPGQDGALLVADLDCLCDISAPILAKRKETASRKELEDKQLIDIADIDAFPPGPGILAKNPNPIPVATWSNCS